MRFYHSVSALLALAATTSAISVPSSNVEVRAVKPLVESNKLRRLMTRSALLSKAKHLEGLAYATTERNRIIGSPGHEATVEWIQAELAKHADYYDVYLQPFDYLIGINATLSLNAVPLEVFPVGMAPAGEVQGDVVQVANLGCDAADFPVVTGKIALIKRGECKSAIKVSHAAELGAVGAIIYNNSPGNLDGYSLQQFAEPGVTFVPTGGITEADGLALIARLGGETVTAALKTTVRTVVTNNVIAETKEGDHENVIHISGHSDSVAAGPGINDNGSGTISILEVALALPSFSVTNAVRFSWWSAEEEGLLGASYYVSQAPQSELDKIRLMLDFDMMASPNFAFQVYDGDGSAYNLTGPPGSAEAEVEFERFFVEEMGQNFTEIAFDGRSDYGPFLEAGVATGGIACGAEGIKTEEEAEMFGGVAGVAYDVNYHAVGDNADNVDVGAWIIMTKAIAHMTATFARSFDLLPANTVEARMQRREIGRELASRNRGMEKR